MPEEFMGPDPEPSFPCPDCESGVRQLEQALERNIALFNAMLLHNRDSILLTGPDGRIVRMLRSLSGYGPSELAGTPVESLIHPEDRGLVRDCYRRLLSRESSSIDIEMRILRRDGSFVWAESTFTDMLDAPDVQGIIINSRDITARREQEVARGEFEAIVQSLDYAIFSKDAEGRILTWNKGAERMFGYVAGEVVGGEASLLIPDDLRDEESGNRRRVLETKDALEFLTELVHKDGSRMPVVVKLAPILDRRGHVRGISHISRALC